MCINGLSVFSNYERMLLSGHPCCGKCRKLQYYIILIIWFLFIPNIKFFMSVLFMLFFHYPSNNKQWKFHVPKTKLYRSCLPRYAKQANKKYHIKGYSEQAAEHLSSIIYTKFTFLVVYR